MPVHRLEHELGDVRHAEQERGDSDADGIPPPHTTMAMATNPGPAVICSVKVPTWASTRLAPTKPANVPPVIVVVLYTAITRTSATLAASDRTSRGVSVSTGTPLNRRAPRSALVNP